MRKETAEKITVAAGVALLAFSFLLLAFDLMTYIFGALMVSFALMEVALPAVLLLVAAYLFVEGYGIYCRFQLEKKI